MEFKVIEVLRGNIPQDTITVWSEFYYPTCHLGTEELTTGDTLLMLLDTTSMSIDSLEGFIDFIYPNGRDDLQYNFTSTGCTEFDLVLYGDTLHGECHGEWENFVGRPSYPLPLTPADYYNATHAAYNDFKTDLTTGICKNYVGVGIDNLYLSINLNLYPNPAHENIYVNIEGGAGASELEITIYDYSGKRMFSASSPDENDVKITVTHLSPGIYFAECQIQSERVIKKFVVI